jgi:DNA polymerase III epsilon subunit-like protein
MGNDQSDTLVSQSSDIATLLNESCDKLANLSLKDGHKQCVQIYSNQVENLQPKAVKLCKTTLQTQKSYNLFKSKWGDYYPTLSNGIETKAYSFIPLKSTMYTQQGSFLLAESQTEGDHNIHPDSLLLNQHLYDSGLINQPDKGLLIMEDCFIFDLETTGLNQSSCGIVSLFIIIMGKEGRRIDYSWPLINPEVKISPEATKVHGITNDIVKNQATFKSIAPKLVALTKGLRPIGYNIEKFDLPILCRLLAEEGFSVPNWKPHVDLYNIYTALNPRNLKAMYSQYCHEDLDNYLDMSGTQCLAHTAQGDCLAVHNILWHLHDAHPELPTSMTGLANWQRTSGRPAWLKQQPTQLEQEESLTRPAKKRKITHYFT